MFRKLFRSNPEQASREEEEFLSQLRKENKRQELLKREQLIDKSEEISYTIDKTYGDLIDEALDRGLTKEDIEEAIVDGWNEGKLPKVAKTGCIVYGGSIEMVILNGTVPKDFFKLQFTEGENVFPLIEEDDGVNLDRPGLTITNNVPDDLERYGVSRELMKSVKFPVACFDDLTDIERRIQIVERVLNPED